MKKTVKKIFEKSRPAIDIIISPFVFVSAILLKFLRKYETKQFPVSKSVLLNVGVYPVRDHYYEPLFNQKHLRKPLSDERVLPGIDWNEEEQLAMLKAFNFQHEFEDIPENFASDTEYYFRNTSFESGDAEYWYNIIRLKRPKRIIEIGSGHSTKMARLAIKANSDNDAAYRCKHICIEPYEMPWLEKTGAEVLRKKVEEIDIDFFQQLDANDILFIDSSHIIRPQGDVLFEYLELIPTLKPGVIVHIHDIFSPRDYPKEWIIDDVMFWNEQYLLEAFLSFNTSWKVIGALNFLCHHHFALLKEKCPRVSLGTEPGSFYMVKK